MVRYHGVCANRDPRVPRDGRERLFPLDVSLLSEGKRADLRHCGRDCQLCRQLRRGVFSHRLYLHREVQAYAIAWVGAAFVGGQFGNRPSAIIRENVLS